MKEKESEAQSTTPLVGRSADKALIRWWWEEKVKDRGPSLLAPGLVHSNVARHRCS